MAISLNDRRVRYSNFLSHVLYNPVFNLLYTSNLGTLAEWLRRQVEVLVSSEARVRVSRVSLIFSFIDNGDMVGFKFMPRGNHYVALVFFFPLSVHCPAHF